MREENSNTFLSLFPVLFLSPCALYVNIQISNSEIQEQTSLMPGLKARTEEGGAGLAVEASVVREHSTGKTMGP